MTIYQAKVVIVPGYGSRGSHWGENTAGIYKKNNGGWQHKKFTSESVPGFAWIS